MTLDNQRIVTYAPGGGCPVEVIDGVFLVQSPVFELLASMFRLECHERLSRQSDQAPGVLGGLDLDLWVARVRKGLPDSVKEQLATFFHLESFLGLTMVRFAWETDAWRSVEGFLARLEETPPHDVFAVFLRTGFTPDELGDVANPDSMGAYIQKTNLPATEQWKLAYLYLNAAHTKEQFIRLLSDCHRLYFQDEEERIAQLQNESIQTLRARIRSRRDVLDQFPYLAGHSVEDPDTTVVLAPSVFYHVDSLSADSDALFLTLYGTEYRAQAQIDPDEMSAFLKLLSDEARVKIIKTLGAGPCYGYELAQRLHLSNSTISHHLSLLATLQIVVATRHENRVAYALSRPRLQELLGSLTAMLTP